MVVVRQYVWNPITELVQSPPFLACIGCEKAANSYYTAVDSIEKAFFGSSLKYLKVWFILIDYPILRKV